MRNILKFSNENAKLEKSGLIIWTFSLPSGRTCPGACQCKAWVNPKTRKLVDGPQQKFRCFSADSEARWPTVYNARLHNMQVLLQHGGATADGLHAVLKEDFPEDAKYFRIHIGGDFYSQAYFDAWVKLAGEKPETKFYAYTKSLPFWVSRIDKIPVNLVLTASRGGVFDHLIEPYNLKTTVVVGHPEEAAAMGLEIDHDDLMAMDDGIRSHALLIHGSQPPGSDMAAAKKRLRDGGVAFGYKSTRKSGAKTPARRRSKEAQA